MSQTVPQRKPAQNTQNVTITRRMPASQRRALMAEQAATLLAEKGFAVSTRDLAAHLGVTQALIYKHFADKDALIDAALDHVFSGPRFTAWAEILADDTRSVAERIGDAYVQFAAASNAIRMRLFVRAGLEGHSFAGRRGAALTKMVFEPVIGALRRDTGMPSFADRPMQRGERELAMMLHGAVVFLAIREHVYRMPMPSDREAVVRLYADTFAAGARQTILALHKDKYGASLAIDQLAPRTRKSGAQPTASRPKRS